MCENGGEYVTNILKGYWALMVSNGKDHYHIPIKRMEL